MKSTLFLTTLALAVSAGAMGSTAAAQPTASAPAIAAPRLGPKVASRAEGYEPPGRPLVLATPTPIFADLNELGDATGRLERVGEPVRLLAKVRGWEWYLVDQGGVGIGYVPRSMLKPAG